MNIIGANLGETITGHPLNDGGCCLISNDRIIAIAEERITKKCHDGGFENSLKYCLDEANIGITEVDEFVFSSCCEVARNIESIKKSYPFLKESNVKVIPSHHLSHACSVYFSSTFEKAIIMVIDNEGNITEDLGEGKYYKNIQEHFSYYIGEGNTITKIGVDEVKPDEIGMGDAYRYFTHYCGFPSYVYAGKTMGLSAFGNSKTFEQVKLFHLDNGTIRCHIPQNYEDCNKAIQDFFESNYNIFLPGPRKKTDSPLGIYADLAFLIQREVERILIEKVEYLVDKYNIHNLCFAGGVALNSVANEKIIRNTNIINMHVVPAAGDSGQCLGNALYSYHLNFNNKNRLSLNNSYLGKKYSEYSYEKEILKLYDSDDNVIIRKVTDEEAADIVTENLIDNKIISVFQGRSEFGPRALGNRSIIMNPSKMENKNILNSKVKLRESFRPFAPIVKEDCLEEWFSMSQSRSPYMLFVGDVKQPTKIPAVTHIDGTARVQTLRKKDNPLLYNIIDKFHKKTGIPIILNTSFNISFQPIVEEPIDAISTFLETNIDVLYIGSYIITKR